MTVPATLLSEHFVPSTTTATVNASVSRTIDTLAGGDNSVVHLVGVVAVGGPVILR